jgi:hypothetical protein
VTDVLISTIVVGAEWPASTLKESAGDSVYLYTNNALRGTTVGIVSDVLRESFMIGQNSLQLFFLNQRG